MQAAPGTVPGLTDGDPQKYPFSRLINRLNFCVGPYGATPLIAAYISVIALCVVAAIVSHEKAAESNDLTAGFLWLTFIHGVIIGAHVWGQTRFMKHDSSRRIYGLRNFMILCECVQSIILAVLTYNFFHPCVFLPTDVLAHPQSDEPTKYVALDRFISCVILVQFIYHILLCCLYGSSCGARFCIKLS